MIHIIHIMFCNSTSFVFFEVLTFCNDTNFRKIIFTNFLKYCHKKILNLNRKIIIINNYI